MSAPKHTNTPECQACTLKLQGTSPILQQFAKEFRQNNVDAHISWGFRGEADQNHFKVIGTTNASFGESPHNFGLALDWFRLAGNGAEFNRDWYSRRLAPAAKAAGLAWGGDWKSLKDYPHIEIKDWKSVRKSAKTTIIA
jgi:hypothetical protein